MNITTWNVNSLNVRLPQVQNWLAEHQPDVLVLQELKLDQDKYPAAALQMMGWHTAWIGQKTYISIIKVIYIILIWATPAPLYGGRACQ